MGATEWILTVLSAVLSAAVVALVGMIWNMRIDARATQDELARQKEQLKEKLEAIDTQALKINTLENKVAFFQDGMIELKRFLKAKTRHDTDTE